MLLCLLFTAIVVKLKLGPKGIAWLAIGFGLPIVVVVVFWDLDAPMSGRVVTTQYVVQLVPYVKGQVKKVCAQSNQPLKKGDLLLEIDPAPYQYAVSQLEAQLASARDAVKQKQAALEASEANVAKAGADIKQVQATVTQSKAALTNAQAALAKAEAGADARSGGGHQGQSSGRPGQDRGGDRPRPAKAGCGSDQYAQGDPSCPKPQGCRCICERGSERGGRGPGKQAAG